jgi:hypothetical protein
VQGTARPTYGCGCARRCLFMHQALQRGEIHVTSLQLAPMQPDALKKKFAWQPLTPSGLARFASVKPGRVLVVQFVFAVMACAVIMRIFYATWIPVMNKAVRELPMQGEIRNGRLAMENAAPRILAENRFFGLAIDPRHAGEARTAAHVDAELGARDLRLYSLSGYLTFAYPTYRIALNHDETIPAWGAWRPATIAVTGGVALVWLFALWLVLQSIYIWPVWFLGFMANRELSFRGAWCVSGAALMPGALFFTLSLIIYGLGWLDLIQLAAAAAIHLVIGWIYLPFAIAKTPKTLEKGAPKENPFSGAQKTKVPPETNPFKK